MQDDPSLEIEAVVDAAVTTIDPGLEFVLGVSFLGLYLVWAELCRGPLDVWARRVVGDWLGLRIVRVQHRARGSRGTSGWGVLRDAGDDRDPRKEVLVGGLSLLVWWAGATLPIVGVVVFILNVDSIPNRLAYVLMLLSMPLMAAFFHLISRGAEA